MNTAGWVVDPSKIDFLKEMQKYSDEPVIATLVEMFLEATPVALQKMKSSLEKNETLTISQEAHKLKANCGNLGLVSMTQLFSQVEESLKTNAPIDLMEALSKAEQYFAQSKIYLMGLK